MGTTSLEKRLRAISKTLERLSCKTSSYSNELVCSSSNVDVSSDASCSMRHQHNPHETQQQTHLQNQQEPINL